MNNSQLWHKYPLIKTQLERVNHCIEKTIQTPYTDLEDALITMADNGGKYLRPSLLILSAQIASGKKEVSTQIIKLASSIEILHMASLIHDDIIDDSDERRGNLSVQAHFGKDTAVYAGDLLFTHFFDLMLQTVDEHNYMVKNAHTMRHILNGELGQMAERFNLKQTLDDYLDNVKGKTAALFKLASEEGAHFAGKDDQITKEMAAFGENLGIAFQMIDDILDYAGGKKLNKPTLEDLATGVYSLPLLLALNKEDLKERLVPILNKQRMMTKDDMQNVQNIILDSSIIDESRALAQKFTDRAIANLNNVPSCPSSKLLIKMTKQLVNRTM